MSSPEPHSSIIGSIFLWIANGASFGMVVISLLGLVPPIAALIAVFWYCIQIYESQTVQSLIRRRKKAQLLRLRAKAAAIESQLNNHGDQ